MEQLDYQAQVDLFYSILFYDLRKHLKVFFVEK